MTIILLALHGIGIASTLSNKIYRYEKEFFIML